MVSEMLFQFETFLAPWESAYETTNWQLTNVKNINEYMTSNVSLKVTTFFKQSITIGKWAMELSLKEPLYEGN